MPALVMVETRKKPGFTAGFLRDHINASVWLWATWLNSITNPEIVSRGKSERKNKPW